VCIKELLKKCVIKIKLAVNLSLINDAKISAIQFTPTNTNYPDDYESFCGRGWQQSYINVHDSSFNSRPGNKYVVSVPVWAGPADMMLGYVSAFMWALLNNASYFITSVESFFDLSKRSIEVSYESPFIQWNASFIDTQYFECLLPTKDYYAHRGRTCRRGTIDIKPGVRLTYTHVMGVDQYKILMKNFIRGGIQSQLYFVASTRGNTFGIFDNPEYADIMRGYGLTRHTIFPCLFNFLFKMREEVCSSACQRTVAMLKVNQRSDPSIIRIGIQIRHSIQTTCHFDCIDQLLDKYDSTADGNKREVILLLICSNYEVQRAAKERYGSRLLLPEGEPVNVTTVHDRKPPQMAKDAWGLDRRAMREAARDMYLLSLTDIKVVSDRSGFALLGSILRPQEEYRMIGVDKAGKIKRNCSAFADRGGDPLSKFAYQWSGLR